MNYKNKILICDFILIICFVLALLFLEKIALPECYIHKLSGLLCISCGGTRMIISLLHFRISEAFFFNPFMFLLLIYGGLFVLLLNISIINKKAIQLIKKLYCLKVCYAWCVFGVLFTILRNLKLF